LPLGKRVWGRGGRGSDGWHPSGQNIRNPLPELVPEEQRELEALKFLADDALWTIAREQMLEDRQVRMQTLMDANCHFICGR
jgi:hypothetical protein